jgi:hypothetical protein
MNTTAPLLFAAMFAVVFTLGLQQLNVEHRHMLAAFFTSPLIGISNLVLFKVLPGPTGWIDIAGYLLGGALGIVACMWMHPHMVALFVRREVPAGPGDPPTPADHAERLGETLRLATELADDIARTYIENHCIFDRVGRFTWYDTTKPKSEGFDIDGGITKALRYLDLRGRVIHHPQQSHLVRFER